MKSVDATALTGAEEPAQGYAFAVDAGNYGAAAKPNVYSPVLAESEYALKERESIFSAVFGIREKKVYC
ncbi:MAG TPA: hypothetical protein VI979_02895 [archaeon]|nr:hypothetical protein [archaeon]